MCYDYSSLSGKIVEKYGTQYNFAIAMKLSERSLSLKLNGKVNWKDSEMWRAINLLDIPVDEIHLYFFKEKVHVMWTKRRNTMEQPTDYNQLNLGLKEGAVERKIYQLIHEYGLSYKEVKRVFEVIDSKLSNYIQSTEISKGKRPLDLTRGQES